MTLARIARFMLLLLAAGCASAPGATAIYAPHPGSDDGTVTHYVHLAPGTFPFRIAPDRDEEPREGVEYAGWETH